MVSWGLIHSCLAPCACRSMWRKITIPITAGQETEPQEATKDILNPLVTYFFQTVLTSLSFYNRPKQRPAAEARLLKHKLSHGSVIPDSSPKTRGAHSSPHERTPSPPPPAPLNSGPCLWYVLLSGGISAGSPLPNLGRDYQT